MAQLKGARALTALVFTFTLTMMGTTLPTPMYAIYQQRFSSSLAMSTVIFAVYALGVLFALLLFGRWSDTVGRRPMLLVGLALAILSDAVFLGADATWHLLVARVLSGFAAGIFVGTATAAIVETASGRWRDRAPLVATAANIGGLGLGPLVAGAFVDWLPWPVHLTFVVHLVLTLLTVGLIASIPETADVRRGVRPGFQRPAVPARARSTFIGAGIAGFAGFAVCGLFVTVSPRLVGQSLASPSAALEGSVVFSVGASVLGQITMHRMSTHVAVDLGCALLVGGLLLLVWALEASSVPLIVVAALVAGAGQGVSFSKGLASVLAKVHAHERAGVISAFFVIAYVALAVPAIGEGLAAQRWGLTPASVGFCLTAAVLAALAGITLVVDQRRGTLA
jgi:MFS family permease